MAGSLGGSIDALITPETLDDRRRRMQREILELKKNNPEVLELIQPLEEAHKILTDASVKNLLPSSSQTQILDRQNSEDFQPDYQLESTGEIGERRQILSLQSSEMDGAIKNARDDLIS